MERLRSMLNFALAAYVFGQAYTATQTACEDSWLPYEGYCYLFGHYQIRFTEAEHFCRQHKGHLIEPYTALENDFFKDRLREFKPHCFWIGITDEVIETHWRWFSSDQPANFTDWDPSDDYHSNQDCGAFWPQFDYSWGDIACTLDCSPLCKRKGTVNEVAEIIG